MVQEVTVQSWGSRLIKSLTGIVIGLVLIILSFVLIFWNESHGLHTTQSLKEAGRVLISVPNLPLDAKNDLQVVYFNGVATTEDVLSDPLFAVSEKAIRINRNVEMYQWQENVKTETDQQVGGSEKTTKTYTYDRVWSASLIQSSQFKDQTGHQNPATFPIASKDIQAQTVTVGDFLLPSELVSQIENAKTIDLTKTDLAVLKKQLNRPVLHDDQNIYIGNDPASPSIGDMKVSLTLVLPQTVSVIGQQSGNTLQPYMARAGKPVMLLAMGQQSAEQMINEAVSQNRILTWILRAVSLVMMVFGIGLILQPLVVLASVIPFLGAIANIGTGLIAFTGGLILWAIATAIAWFAIRPFWALGLIVLVSLICYGLFSHRKNKYKKLSQYN
jgi:hypothetical protein